MTILRDFPPTHAEIAVAAYYIWLQETEMSDPSPFWMSEDLAIANWLQAERQLREECHRECREEGPGL
jgi:hypothetical protein